MTKDQATKKSEIVSSVWPGAAGLPVFKHKAKPSVSSVCCEESMPSFYTRFSNTEQEVTFKLPWQIAAD